MRAIPRLALVLALALPGVAACSSPPDPAPRWSVSYGDLATYDEAWSVATNALDTAFQGELALQDREGGVVETGWRMEDEEAMDRLVRRKARVTITGSYTFEVEAWRQTSTATDEYGTLDRENPRWGQRVADPTLQDRILDEIRSRVEGP